MNLQDSHLWTVDFGHPTTDRAPSTSSKLLQVERMIGEGSSGFVFLARSVAFPHHVCALKVPKSNLSLSDAEKVERECNVLQYLSGTSQQGPGKLEGSYIPRYYGLLEIQAEDVNPKFGPLLKGAAESIVTEYVVGGTLGDFCKARESLMNERHMMHWITQALECLAFVHGKRILHRDIKPSNFLVRCPAATEMVLHFKNSSITAEDCYLYQLDRTELLLSDFGESLFLPSAEDKATPKSVVGTPAFCAPEILRFWGCKDQCLYDRRADLWSMGATLYTLLLGGPSAADKGVSCLFHASAARGNMEMLTMLLITKGLYPKLMEFRYGTFPEPNFNGTLNASVYTDADLDTNGTGYKHWIYNQLQLSAIQRRFKAKWSAIPDPTLAAIDRMMALRPEDRPHSAVSIVEYLRSITSPMSAVPPPSTVNRLIHLYERSLLWQISLRDAKMSMTPAPTNLDSKEYTNWTNVTEFFTRQLTEAESMLERFKSALSVQNSARLHLYLNPVLSPNVILENIGALFRAQNNVSLARIIFTNPN